MIREWDAFPERPPGSEYVFFFHVTVNFSTLLDRSVARGTSRWQAWTLNCVYSVAQRSILETVVSTCRSGCRTRRGPASHLPTMSVAGDRLFSMPALDIRMNALLKKWTHAQAQRWYLSWSYHTSVLVDSRGESARIPASDIPKPRGHRQ